MSSTTIYCAFEEQTADKGWADFLSKDLDDRLKELAADEQKTDFERRRHELTMEIWRKKNAEGYAEKIGQKLSDVGMFNLETQLERGELENNVDVSAEEKELKDIEAELNGRTDLPGATLDLLSMLREKRIKRPDLLEALMRLDLSFGAAEEAQGNDMSSFEDFGNMKFLFALFAPEYLEALDAESVPTAGYITLFERLSREKILEGMKGVGLTPEAKRALKDLGGLEPEWMFDYILTLRPVIKKIKSAGAHLVITSDYGGIESKEALGPRAEKHLEELFQRNDWLKERVTDR